MAANGMNDPCPCGSGKKFKDCCLGGNGSYDQQALIRRVMEEVREKLNQGEFDSIVDAQKFVNGFMERRHALPEVDFLGLSSNQVHRMLYDPLETLEDMVKFNDLLDPDAFQDIPIVRNILLFLSGLKELGPLRTTAKGNLPLAFVRELYGAFVDPSARFQHRIRSEKDAMTVETLRHVLRMCGWMKKERNRFSLTRKGEDLAARGFSGSHFSTLMHVFTRRFNWAFQDGYPPFWIIQGGFLFSLYLLHQKGREYISAKDLGEHFLRAFPTLLSEAGSAMPLSPAENVRRCFSLRFLERFCEYFGLVDIRREKKSAFELDLLVKTSALYDKYIQWNVR